MKKGSTAKEKLAKSIGGIICHIESVISIPTSAILPIKLTNRNAKAIWIPENKSTNKAMIEIKPISSGLIFSYPYRFRSSASSPVDSRSPSNFTPISFLTKLTKNCKPRRPNPMQTANFTG